MHSINQSHFFALLNDLKLNFSSSMLSKDNFVTLSDDVKFELYRQSYDDTVWLRTIIHNLSLNTKANNESINENNCNEISTFENRSHSKYSNCEQTTQIKSRNPFTPNVIQTRGVTARNPINSTIPKLGPIDFTKDVTEPTESQPNHPEIVQKHLSLPKNSTIQGLIIGDSITNRINGQQVGQSIVARGFCWAYNEDAT